MLNKLSIFTPGLASRGIFLETATLEFESYRHHFEGLTSVNQPFERQKLEEQAWQLIKQRETRNPAEVWSQERRDNARTALMEALTASGHLSRVELKGTLEEINHQVLSRLLNGWDDSLPHHEKQRRFAELCNELAIQEVHRSIAEGQLPFSTGVIEISDYPISLDDKQASSLGYRASNRKGMVRSTHLQSNDDGSFTRVIEQPSRSNAVASSTFQFLKAANISLNYAKAEDLAVLEAPFLYSTDDYVDGVVDIMRGLDQQALTRSLYGDTPDKATRHVPYEQLRAESARRESEIECYIDELADLELQLDSLVADNQIGRQERSTIFKEEVDRILTAICTLNPDYAQDTFGQKAAVHFSQASQMYAQGHDEMARQALESAHYLKETVTFCGVEISIDKAQKDGLKLNPLLDLLAKGRERWQWKKGVCVVKECPTRPSKTEVGPCNVCRKCQKIYDNGDSPQSVYKTLGFLDWLFGLSDK